MYLIAGLGNPTQEYRNTRHNVGFDVIERLADEEHIEVHSLKHKALIGKGVIAGQKVLLAKPQTYMNASGESIRELVDYYGIDPSCELIVISDDINLDLGQIRIRKKGSAGGHNGLKNIIALLGSEEFMRIRVGVGRKPEGYDQVDYVLGHFDGDERAVMDDAAGMVSSAIRTILSSGVDEAMNQFNRRVQEREKGEEHAGTTGTA